MCTTCFANNPAIHSVHVFEVAGLGVAPFTLTGVNYDSEGTHCDYCGTAIVNVFWLRGSVSPKLFKVGSDCILKSGDAGLIKVTEAIIRKHEREKREAKAKFIAAELTTLMADETVIAAAKAAPHPRGWSRSAWVDGKRVETPLTGYDYLQWYTRKWSSAADREKAYRFIKFGYKIPPKGARLADIGKNK